jgi:CheY-like chemotaxis protein
LPGILVVERSTTLSHLLRRTLTASGISPRSELASYFEAIDHLRRSAELDQPYGLLLVGAPARLTREFGALLEFLRGPDGSMLPVVLMTHELLPELEEFARTRGNLSLVLWTNFSRIPGVLRALMPENEDDPAAFPIAAGPAPVTGIHILFVDDSPSVRLAYQHLLERNGFQVSTAGSIGEADAMAAQAKYDLVIVDYYLPDGNGDELCRRLSSKPGAPGLAIITGTYREDVIKRCLEAGATECMFKNEATELFLARVRE